MATRIIDYDVWAFSPSTNKEQWPARPRSAITEQEAKEQADEFIAHLVSTTGITDWEGKWKVVMGEVDA